MQNKTYQPPCCHCIKVETESLMEISAGVGGWSDGGPLSKKNYFDEEDFNTNWNGNESATTSGEEVKR